ncbi:C40 family peptidase [Streptomyces lavendulae]|uniref:C40 family peptidase n=1 Tax=Streptomyces lavendulae TaxID=1914 RepID=UPI003F4D319E
MFTFATALTPKSYADTPPQKVLAIVKSKSGAPYSYGAAGPNRFDCSGLVYYAFKKSGKILPRTASAQQSATHQIGKNSRAVGDIVFFHSRRGVYHVGIYAGNGKMWHAPKPGGEVRLERIWSRNVTYGRVIF